MLDLGLTKLTIIGVVALIVVGPEKLPRLARNAGRWVARIQRYVSSVKADMSRQIELEELRQMETELRSSASKLKTSVAEQFRETERQFTALEAEVRATTSGSAGTTGTANPSVAEANMQTAQAGPDAPQADATQTAINIASEFTPVASGYDTPNYTSKRRNKRAVHVVPLWYLRQNRRHTRALSGAARVARYRPRGVSGAKPTSF